ncbi:hypothetical protein [Krasilnikoviella flava]|uniref:Uncharacterized protein n=1 Tax=Krasilnikoviella flava TaxID=526729 RepID=A0A1T5K3F0_9MICO|nr:hypothetical protein [Krasilnikoviella flava]SKC58226.1 hypothetical protein SAMN04324258_1803 [Krasilnikoviella flava]
MRARHCAVGLVAVAALALAGCTSPGDDAQPLPSGVAQGLTAELRQDRTQYADRRAVLRVVNGSDSTVTLLGGSLDAPGFGPSSPDGAPRARELAPGAGRDVRLRLGEVDCDATAPDPLTGAAAQQTPVATATVRVAAGDVSGAASAAEGATSGTAVDVEVIDPLARLAAVHAEACAERLVASGVTLRVADVEAARVRTSGGVEPGGRVTLGVEPVPGGPDVHLVEISGTTLLSPARGVAWTGDDLAGQDDGRVVLDLVPARCDPHVVAEDKRGTFLPLHTEVDGAPQPVIHVPMSDEQRAVIYQIVHDACGWD